MLPKSTGMRLSLVITYHHSDLPPQLAIFPASSPASLYLAPYGCYWSSWKERLCYASSLVKSFHCPNAELDLHRSMCPAASPQLHLTLPPALLSLAFFQFLPEPISSPFYCLLQTGLSSLGRGRGPLLFFSSQFRHHREKFWVCIEVLKHTSKHSCGGQALNNVFFFSCRHVSRFTMVTIRRFCHQENSQSFLLSTGCCCDHSSRHFCA